MDYETKPVSRHDLRKFAPEFRMMFHVPLTGPLPVMQLLDKFADVFPEAITRSLRTVICRLGPWHFAKLMTMEVTP